MQDVGKAVGRPIPFASYIGIRLRAHGDGQAVVEADLRPELMNSWDSAHGGVVMTLLDVAMAVAARSMDPKAAGAITVEMKTSFIGTCQGLLVAHGRCIHLGRSVAFCEGEARDAAGKLVAKATGTFMVRRERPGGQDDALPRDTRVST
jgi:uncharacterized protein (TIGR00369 family)